MRSDLIRILIAELRCVVVQQPHSGLEQHAFDHSLVQDAVFAHRGQGTFEHDHVRNKHAEHGPQTCFSDFKPLLDFFKAFHSFVPQARDAAALN